MSLKYKVSTKVAIEQSINNSKGEIKLIKTIKGKLIFLVGILVCAILFIGDIL